MSYRPQGPEKVSKKRRLDLVVGFAWKGSALFPVTLLLGPKSLHWIWSPSLRCSAQSLHWIWSTQSLHWIWSTQSLHWTWSAQSLHSLHRIWSRKPGEEAKKEGYTGHKNITAAGTTGNLARQEAQGQKNKPKGAKDKEKGTGDRPCEKKQVASSLVAREKETAGQGEGGHERQRKQRKTAKSTGLTMNWRKTGLGTRGSDNLWRKNRRKGRKRRERSFEGREIKQERAETSMRRR